MGGSKLQKESVIRNNGEDFFARIGAKGGSAKTEKTKLRGFASMTPERLIEISKLGGKKK